MQGYGEGAYWRDPDQGFWDAEQRDADLARAERLAERVWEPRGPFRGNGCAVCRGLGTVVTHRSERGDIWTKTCPECKGAS